MLVNKYQMQKQNPKSGISLVSPLLKYTKQQRVKSQIWDVLGMQSFNLGNAW